MGQGFSWRRGEIRGPLLCILEEPPSPVGFCNGQRVIWFFRTPEDVIISGKVIKQGSVINWGLIAEVKQIKLLTLSCSHSPLCWVLVDIWPSPGRR